MVTTNLNIVGQGGQTSFEARNGMTVLLDAVTVTDLGNGYSTYSVTYTEKNLTSIAIDQATLRLYFSNADPSGQYGFFGRVLPGENFGITTSYSFTELNSAKPLLLQYDSEHFFEENPINGALQWGFEENSLVWIQGQTFTGTSANELFPSGAGTDTINGGGGTDTAAYSGARSNYTVTKTTTGYTVKDATGADGIDTLTNVEQLQFVDHTVNLAQMDRVFKYFVAYYGRAPASTGKDYWLDNLSGSFANDEKQLVWNFGSATQTEFINLYGSGGTVSDFVSKVYNNLFNRTPLQTGLDYWNGIYDAKKAEGKDDNAIRGEMVTWIMDGATDSATNKDLTTLNNKVLAASMFTAAVDTPAELAGYRIASNTTALDYAREWLHEITNDSTSLNSHIDPVALDQTIIQLVGLYEPVG